MEQAPLRPAEQGLDRGVYGSEGWSKVPWLRWIPIDLHWARFGLGIIWLEIGNLETLIDLLGARSGLRAPIGLGVGTDRTRATSGVIRDSKLFVPNFRDLNIVSTCT